MALRSMSVDIDFGIDLSAINRLDDTIDDTIRSITRDMNRAENSVNGLGDEFGDLASDVTHDMGRVGDSIRDIGSDVSSSVNDIGRLDSAISDVARSGNRLNGLRSDFDGVGRGANDARTDVNQLADSFVSELGGRARGAVEELSGGIDGLSGALASIGIGLGAGEIISSTNEIDKAMNGLQAQTGLTDKEMVKFNDEMLDLYKNNYGESIEDLSMKMGKVMQVTGEVDPSKVKELTKNAIALEETFGSDFNETVRGVKNMMNHFGLSSEEAFDLFAKGSQLGLDYTDELGDNVAEYGGNFAQAGYTADEYFQLLKNGAKGGAYNLDKVNDSINEVKNRLGDGTIEKNIGMFGEGTQTLFKKWQDGDATMKEVIDSIVGDINNCENEQQALTMAATAFGTMGEDANLNVVKSLTSLGDEFQDVEGTAEDLNKVKYDDAMTSISGLGRTIQTDIAEKATPIVEGLGKAAQFMADNWNWLGPIITAVAIALGLLAGAWGVYTVAQAIANMTIWACPFVWIVVAIIAVIAIIITLILYWDEVVAAMQDVWNWIVEIWGKVAEWFMTNVVDPVVQFFSDMWEGIKSVFSTIAEWFMTNIVNPIVSFFTMIYEAVMSIVNAIVGFVMNTILPIVMWFWNYIINPIIQIVMKIWEIIFTLVQVGIQFVMSIILTIVEWINVNIIQPIVNFFVNLWNKIVEIWNSIVSSVMSIVIPIANWVNENVIQPLVNFFTGLWNKITEIFGKVASWFSEKFQAAYDGVTNIFSNISSFFSGIWEDIKSIFTNIGQSIADGVSGAFKSTVNAVIGFAEDTINGFIKGVNAAIDLINAIPGVSISKLDLLSIPRLATGGVVEGSTVANIGEAGAEAVVPLEKNLGWLNKMGGMIANAILSQAQYQPSGNVQSSGGQSITVQEGAIQITIHDTGNSSETANKVKNTIESFFAQIRRGGSYAVTEV